MDDCKFKAGCTRRPSGIASVFTCLMCTLARQREQVQRKVLLQPHVRAAAIKRGEERIERLKEEVAQYHRKGSRNSR